MQIVAGAIVLGGFIWGWNEFDPTKASPETKMVNYGRELSEAVWQEDIKLKKGKVYLPGARFAYTGWTKGSLQEVH